MKNRNNNQTLIIVILIITILVMSVGFAAFATNLNINGTAVVAGSKWSVEFNPTSYKETLGSVKVDEAARTINGSSITYEVKLTKPGDFYEFEIDVENKGTFDANLTAITISPLDSLTTAKYIKHTVFYEGTPYNVTTGSLSIPLAKNNGVGKAKVRVEYLYPDDPKDLPSAPETRVALNASLTFTQV